MPMVCSQDCPLASSGGTLSPPASCNAKKLEEVVCKYFGFDSFLPGQLEAIVPAMHGKDVLGWPLVVEKHHAC